MKDEFGFECEYELDYIGYSQGTKDADEVRIRKLHFL